MADFHTWFPALLAQPELANWLQAFAAVLALGISVWAAWRAGAADRKRDRLQARGITVAIDPELLKLQVTVDYIKKAWAVGVWSLCYICGGRRFLLHFLPLVKPLQYGEKGGNEQHREAC
jgi:hypothetical protein